MRLFSVRPEADLVDNRILSVRIQFRRFVKQFWGSHLETIFLCAFSRGLLPHRTNGAANCGDRHVSQTARTMMRVGPATGAELANRPSRVRAWYDANERMILGVAGILLLLIAWEVLVATGQLNPQFSSSPSRVFKAGIGYFGSGSGLEDIKVTALEFVIGFSGAAVIGLGLGLLMGWYRRFEAVIDPIFNFAYTSPRPALFPLFVIWFGIGIESKIALVFVSTIFPVVIATAVGVKTVDRSLLNVAWSFNGSTGQVFRTIVLPSSVPHIVSGIRVGLGHALTAVIFGEMVVANMGIGYSMGVAANNFDTDLVFCGFILVGAFGVTVAELLRRVEKRLETWRPDIHR